MRDNRDDRHSGGKCEGQGEDYGYLFHDRVPLAGYLLPEAARGLRDRRHVFAAFD